jgi:hypothetical protein
MKFGLYGLEGNSQMVEWGTGWIKVLKVDLDRKAVKDVKQ